MKTIGIIGHGHLGQAVEAQMNDVLVQSELHPGPANRWIQKAPLIAHNAEEIASVASQADLLVLCVRPSQVLDAIAEIRKHAKANLPILSFAAAVPLEAMESFGQPVARAMTEISFSEMAVTDADFAQEFCSELSFAESVLTVNEEGVDDFTILVGCLPGVALWHHSKLGAETNGKWLAGYVEFIEKTLHITGGTLKNIAEDVLGNDPYESTEERIKRIATKGGITEALIAQLEQDPQTDFETMLATGRARMQAIIQSLTKPK